MKRVAPSSDPSSHNTSRPDLRRAGEGSRPDSGPTEFDQTHSVIAPPRPSLVSNGIDPVFSPLSGQGRPEPSESEPSEVTELSLKRDYDYFTDLDTTLARLQPITPRPTAGGSPGLDAHCREGPAPAFGGAPGDNGSDP